MKDDTAFQVLEDKIDNLKTYIKFCESELDEYNAKVYTLRNNIEDCVKSMSAIRDAQQVLRQYGV